MMDTKNLFSENITREIDLIRSKFPEGKNKSADEELTRLRQRYLDELGTDQEKTYWGGVEQDVNSPKMKTLSLSLLKAYFEQQPTKPDIAIVDFNIDWVGFEIDPEYVVGFGLDYDQKLRNLNEFKKRLKAYER